MKLHEVSLIALEAGEILLRNGAETYRVEESITKICNGLGLSCESFVLPTGIFLTVFSPEMESESFIRRIRVRTLNLTKIDQINTFSRKITAQPVTYHEAIQELSAIKASDPYPTWIHLLCATLFAFAFALIYGGSLTDGLIASVVGALAFILNRKMMQMGYFSFLIQFVLGFLGGFFALISNILFPGIEIYIIIISSVLLYLPGFAMTTAVRDLLSGDTVSGLTRLGEAVLSVVALGMGVGLALSIVHFIQ